MKNSLACLLALGMLALPCVTVNAAGNSRQVQVEPRVTPPIAKTPLNSDKDDDKIDLLTLIPDGSRMTYDEFRKSVGDRLADKFKSIKPKSIERQGNNFTLCTDGSTHTKYGVTVAISIAVTFQATKHDRVLTAKNIEGVNVQVGPKIMQLRELVITALPEKDQVRLDGKLELSSSLPYIPLSITVDKSKVHQ